MTEQYLTICGIPTNDLYGEVKELLNDVITVFSNVASLFKKRNGVTEEDFIDVLRDPSCALDGSELGQKPETFTNQYLVHPLLEIFGFNYVIEPRMLFDTIGSRESGMFADFRLLDLSYTRRDQLIGGPWGDKEFVNTYEPNVFGEVKCINSYEEAKKDIRQQYVRPYTDIDVGIATDGLDWGVYIDIPRAETWLEFSFREFAMKVANHIYDRPVLQEERLEADHQMMALLRLFLKPNFERFLFERDAGVMWE